MLYRFDTYHCHNPRPGEPKMLRVNDTPGQCSVQSTNIPHAILNFFIDNDTVIKQLKYVVRPEMGSTKHCNTDYDIWAETIHLLDCIPCTSAFTHVKGHQDDALYAFCKVRSPLPRLAHYTIEMDRIAAQCRTVGIQPPMTTVLPTSKIALVHITPKW